ncbi:PilW family protein [Cupriavidus sp. UYPR2.512]|uniref:PilW family protein n=1 Tax=Cupriavidus sp. UYPR2.512 TaxID=1080187 RepID=UPI00035E1C48|nr:PilW family protein [Cupriavidus sp. UYPR2.512]UIF85390.1 PilW family protein [Cupriavidus necator]
MRWQSSKAFSLIELLVGLMLGLVVTAAAMVAFQASRTAYLTATDRILLEERGQRALTIIASLLRQSGWPGEPISATSSAALPAVSGADNCGQPAMGAMPSCGKSGIGRSDALLVRFSGSALTTAPAQPDETMVDCSGYAVAARMDGANANSGYVATNVLYVAAGSDGVPQLLCRYPARRNGVIDGIGWTSGALIRGIESLQVRYGLDTDGDGRADRFETASTIQPLGESAWHRVVAVQVAIAVRGDRPGSAAANPGHSADPLPTPGTAAGDLAPAAASQAVTARRVFATTVRLRNAPRCQETLC